jgi:anthranilate/para-aminobenzoate synthase component II
MSIEKLVKVSNIEVLDNKMIKVRKTTDIIEDGLVIASSHDHIIIAPGDDYSNQAEEVKKICAAVHTSEVVAEYEQQNT